MNPLFVSIVLLLLPLLFVVFRCIDSKSKSPRRKPLPPGPKPWPIIGNILQVGTKPHISLTNFAKDYGPLISLKLGSKLLIVGSSPVAAIEILKTQDRLLSGRYLRGVVPYSKEVIEGASLIWSPTCSESWKALRTLCRTELFSAKALETQANLREKKAREMVEFLNKKQGQVVNIGEVVFATVFDALSNVFFSRDLLGLEEGQGRAAELKVVLAKVTELATAPNIVDFYPIFARFDPQGIKHNSKEFVAMMFDVWGPIIKERRQRKSGSSLDPDFLDVLLANNFNDDQINTLILELLTAGTDTTVATVEWALAELLKNRDVLSKVNEELRREMKRKSCSIMMGEFDICQLPYLSACIKETLRLHPPVPFLVPHRAEETCEILNYTIPKDCEIFVNVWAIGRDPTIWDDPLTFNPDRFLNSKLDFKGHDYELVPFGAGRRSCPGMPMASRQSTFILASLIYCFDWSLPDGQDPTQLDMNERLGITLHKEHPLLLLPITKT